MRFEKEKRFGETVKVNIIVYIAFIGIAFGLAARNYWGSTPKYWLAVACVACGVYMVIFLLRFIRLLKTWEKTYLAIDDDTVSGLSIDPRSFRSEPFEISLKEVEDAGLKEIKMTRRSPLPALVIRTASNTYTVVGIQDINTARNKLLPENELY